jgi:hypothetical protein
MLGNFEDQAVFATFDFEGVKNWWSTILELNIDNGSNNGDD